MRSVDTVQAVWRDDCLNERFEQLTSLLKDSEPFWRHHAFKYLQLPWESELPELSRRLRAMSLAEAEQLACDENTLRDFLSKQLPLFSRITDACAIGHFDEPPLPNIEPHDVPGRKWQQIRYFAPCVPVNNFTLLEWCAGKSHLGRTLAQQRHSAVTALEYDERLIAAGSKLAAKEKMAIDFRCVDVMSDAAIALLQSDQNAIALHACGDLHTQLLMLCAQKKVTTITLAPCCYQLMADESRFVISQAARASGLCLQRDDLRSAVHGTVTASALENRRRQQLQAWRLGFDLLQRELHGCDEYLATPSLSVRALQNGFAAFCRQIAVLRHIKLPDAIDYPHYEQAGHARLRTVTALDLPRIAFRRLLELWLVLDRAHFLRENGYEVAVGIFCPRELTPRNLLIKATMPRLVVA